MDINKNLGTEIVALLREGESQDFETVAVISSLVQLPPITEAAAFDGKIRTISIAGVRAFAAKQTLKLSDGLTVVYAANGSGKTSITDAIELAVYGATTRMLGNEGNQSEVKDSAHIGHALADGSKSEVSPRVEFTWTESVGTNKLNSSIWDGTFGRPAVPVAPPVRVIARRRLREMVAASGVERAQRLGSSLGINEFSDSLDSAIQILSKIKPGLDLPVNLPSMVIQDISERLSGNDATQPAEIDAWFSGRTSDPRPAPSCPVYVARPPAVPELTKLVALGREWSATESQGTAEPKLSETERLMLSSFLDVAGAGDECPTCRAGIVQTRRLADIRQLLDAHSANSDRFEQRISLRARFETVVREYRHMPLSWEIVPRTGSESSGREHEAAHDVVAEVSKRWNKTTADFLALFQDEPLLSQPFVDKAIAAIGLMSDIHDDANVAVETLEGSCRNATQINQQADPIAEWARSNRHRCAEIVLYFQDLLRQEVLSKRCGEAVDYLKGRRLAAIDERLAELAEPINDWLAVLAPEHTPRIHLEAKPTSGRPALKVYVDSADIKIDALGRLSDSQLDMLGLAAHFALLDREDKGIPLVIDDPTDMLDRATREKLASDGIAKLMSGHGSARQVIVLTHDDEFVKELWKHARDHPPAIAQDYIEVERSRDDAYAVLVSRTAKSSVYQARQLLNDYREKNSHRLWFRSALATHVRQAAELFAKELATVLGPSGHNRLSAQPEDSMLSQTSDLVLKDLKELSGQLGECGSSHHIPAIRKIGNIRDLLDNWIGPTLNSGAHADTSLPEAASAKKVLEHLDALCSELEAPGGLSRSAWTTESTIALALAPCICVAHESAPPMATKGEQHAAAQ